MSQQNHPDVGGNPEVMKNINNAYETLNKRAV
jgi:hypothetical protein